MKVVLLQGSIVGSKTRMAINRVESLLHEHENNLEVEVLDLADYDLPFSDGRNYLEYTGDAGHVTKTLMEADVIFIGTPIFQASIPATLKNVFDLLPEKAFMDKVVSIIVTAGSAKHYLIPETQLKPIIEYMKGQTLPTYVFIEEKDFYRKEIINDDVILRLESLIDETLTLAQALEKVREEKEAEFDF